MTAAQEAYAALTTLAGTCTHAGKELARLRHAERTGEENAEFALLHARLGELAHAIGALPPSLTRRVPGIPWRELERLPALLARPDIRCDYKILDITLAKLLLQLGNTAMSLRLIIADDPSILDPDFDISPEQGLLLFSYFPQDPETFVTTLTRRLG